MSARDNFTVWLYDLDAGEVEYRVLDDGRHVLHITQDVALWVRPETDDLSIVIAGLRKLAETAGEMAGALGGEPGDEPEEPEPQDYDPGPEIDDEGGMSEYRHVLPEDYERGQS